MKKANRKTLFKSLKNKGISLITLVITIIVLAILTFTMAVNINPYKNEKIKKDFETDLKRLEEKVSQYYTRTGELPIKNKYNVELTDEFLATRNVNDNDTYYVIDLNKLNVSLYYGDDYGTIANTYDTTIPISDEDKLSDVYIINEQSNTIYYVKGREYDGNRYYRIEEVYSEISTTGKANIPILVSGMTPIKFTDGGDTKKTTESDKDWYDYGNTETARNWANVQTKDGSMWVWIPRFAYKINGSTIDIKFLSGTSDKYLDDGKEKTAKRITGTNQINSLDSEDYIVHPAFTNGTSVAYKNGGEPYEISGFWVSKFEAGYAGGNNSTTEKESNINYTSSGTNYYGGYSESTKIKYPTFQGTTYSINNISINDAYRISKALTDSGNIYGFSKSSANSHMIKNSEWGAIAYLSKSSYGQNIVDITANKANLNNSPSTIYAVAGYADGTGDTYKWYNTNGVKASTTGTIYGVYDMSGGALEYTAALVSNGNTSLANRTGTAK